MLEVNLLIVGDAGFQQNTLERRVAQTKDLTRTSKQKTS
jgi:hypothetical protein